MAGGVDTWQISALRRGANIDHPRHLARTVTKDVARYHN